MPAHAVCAPSAARARAAADFATATLKIISGGQTGVDRGALDAALAAESPCGGLCPADRLAEDGRIPELYPVTELKEGGYGERTAQNVADSDGTLIISNGPLMGGTGDTLDRCLELKKPHLVLDCTIMSAEEALERAERFVCDHTIEVLNVAGPRASQWPAGHAIAQRIVSNLLRRLSGHTSDGEYSS